MLLRDVSDLVVDRVQVGAVWRPQIRSGNSQKSYVPAAERIHGRGGSARYPAGMNVSPATDLTAESIYFESRISR